MKNLAVIFLLVILSLTVFSQKPKTAKNTKPAAKSNLVKTEKLGDENAEFELAATTPDAPERIAELQKFMVNFPASEKKTEARELIVAARATDGDEKLRAGDAETGTEMFRLAVKEAPVPFSDKLFNEIVLQFPTNLFWRGQQKAALEVAQMIEVKVDGNAKQTLGLATFYLGIENAAEAERLARKAIALDAALPAAYQTLGLAHRINFQLDEAAMAYAKALELDPASSVSKRSLAEMKRATGKPDEAAALYREILTADASDAAAQTGLILALFDGGKRAEAESEMQKSVEASPNNLPLLVGAAYWYAASGEGAKAVDLAAKAVAIEPRYTWAHIALARGFAQQKRPLDAERTLLAARQFGNFPTLDYEIASARLRAGFFREAAEILRQNFTVKGDAVETKLGGRVARESDNFIDLLAPERRASIFQPTAADDRETAEKLKSLLVFTQKLDAADETEIGRVADRFVEGDDAMLLHRQLFAANRLLQNGKALSKTQEIMQSALGKTDAALNVPSAAAAVLADELYESRTLAAGRNQLIVVPEVPRQTLSAILRGRIEEIAGWTFYQQNNPAQAVVRLKRAVSVLPDGSAWWRSSMWRLGAALQADGKEKEALDVYLRSYPKDSFDSAKYAFVETLYQKVNGSLDGLDARIGAQTTSSIITPTAIKPAEATAQSEVKTDVKTESKPPQIVTAKPLKIPDNVPLMLTAETAAPPQIETPKETVAAPEKILNAEPLAETPKIESIKENSESVKESSSTNIRNFNQTPNPVVEPRKNSEKDTFAPEIPSNTEVETTTKNDAENSTLPEKTSTESSQSTENQPIAKEVSVSEVKTESVPETAPVETSLKPSIASKEKSASAKPDASSDARSMFEPIIITVPKRDPLKTSNPAVSASDERVVEKPVSTEKSEIADLNGGEPAKQTSAPAAETVAEIPSITRPRVVVTDNLLPEKIKPCSIIVNQEEISLLNGGGVLGVLVGFKGGGDLKQLVAASSSPDDVEVVFEPEIIAPEGQAFFVVKSVSAKTGVFSITFEAPCGKQEMSVKVR